ncbi:MAG: hypothetical protein K2K97_08420, partial [Muribaculaceae bacterium]|nr:hypothetical protein [Muribaculaceae bacterium]
NVDKDIFNYDLNVRGQTITLTCKNIDSPTNAIRSGSAYGNLVLTIPAGTYTVDGEPNSELTYSYSISSFTAKSITANPAPSDDSYSIAELRDISLEFSDEMQKGTTNLTTTVKLEQWVDGKWQDPIGFSSAVYYAIEWIDTYHARIYPRPIAGNYTYSVDDLETGRYAFHFVKNYMKSADGVSNQDIYLGPYYIEGATEATIIKHTPAANGAIRASDWEDLIFEFSSEMGPGDTDEKLVIKDASGKIVRQFDTTEVEWDGDFHSGRILLDPPIIRGSEEMVYTVEMPRGFMQQRSGSGLPSQAAKFNVIVGRNVAIEGNYPKYSVTPDPKTFGQMTGLGTFTFVYYGADSVELGDELPVFKTNGTSSGGDVTVTVGKSSDDFPTVIVTFKNKVYSAVNGYKYTLEVPRLAWTISRGEHVYSTEENITYQWGGGNTNVTSTTVQTGFSGSTTISYADHTESELTKAQAVEYFSTVKINPGNKSGMQVGSGKATLKKASDNSVIATYTSPSSVVVSSANYTAELNEDMFLEGETYYWELPTDAIQYKATFTTYSMSAALKVYFTILSESALPQYYDIHVANTAGKPRVRLDHIEFVSDTDNSTYGFAIAKNFSAENVYIGDENGNRLTKEGSEDDGGVTDRYTIQYPTHKGNWISCSISPTITEQGKYTIVVPEKAFSIDGVDYNNALVHPFEIKDNHVEWSIPIYEQISTRDEVQGAQDHPMKGFNRITLTFPEDIDVKVDTRKSSTFRKVWEETSGQDTYEKEDEPASKMSMSASGNEVYLDFNPPLTDDGTYRVVLPEGAVLMMGAFDEYVPVTSYRAYFTIKDTTTATVEPADGSSVTELSEVTFNFTKASEVSAPATPTAPAGLYDADMNEIEGYKLSVRTEGTKGIISITPPLNVDGDYTIIVPEGRFRCKASASAAEEDVTEYRLKYTVVDPSIMTSSLEANSVLTSLDNIEFEFLKAVNVDLTEGAKASVKDASGNVLSEYTVKLTQDKDYSDCMIFAAIEPAVTATGKYSFVLDANSAACQRTWTGAARNNVEVAIPFEVVNPTDCTVDPESGSELHTINSITVEFTNAESVVNADKAEIEVIDKTTDAIVRDYTVSVEMTDDTKATLTFTPAIAVSGEYKIVVPAGAFACKLTSDGEAIDNEEFALFYTVNNHSNMVFQYGDSDIVLGLENMIITFPEAEKVRINDDPTIGDITLEHNVNNVPTKPAEAKSVHLLAEGTDVTSYTVTPEEVGANQIKLNISPKIEVPGETTLHIPAGKFIADDVHYSQEAHPVIKVTDDSDIATRVDEVLGECDTVTVVNMNGYVILRNAPKTELRNLAPGLYIINGQAVIIR